MNLFSSSALNYFDQNLREAINILVSGTLPLVRLLLSPRLDVALFELQDLKRFNMMSQCLSSWFGLASVFWHALRRSPDLHRTLNVRGAGLHMCPGGYVPKHRNNVSQCSSIIVASYFLYRFFVCLRSLQCHRFCVLHGVVVGGGVALALHSHVLLGAAASTLSFGNLSRGAMPGMRLSRTLPRAHCLAFGVSLF